MERFEGKVAIITGASAGIGAATAKVLVEAGMIVVGLARRKERIEELDKEIREAKGKLYAVKADVTKEEEILQAFKWIGENVGPVHVLVNNAGVARTTDLVDGETEKWKTILDTNVLALAITSREAIKVMRSNNIDGHIININSNAGHEIPNFSGLNVYPASKFAVTALTETLRLELIRLGSKIKVTSLSPGLVATEIFEASGFKLENVRTALGGTAKALESKDIANAVKYILFTPSHVQVTELTIRPLGEVYT